MKWSKGIAQGAPWGRDKGLIGIMDLESRESVCEREGGSDRLGCSSYFAYW
jgi:hypothetical protein